MAALPLSSHPPSLSPHPPQSRHHHHSLLFPPLRLRRNPNLSTAHASASDSSHSTLSTADALPKSPIQRIADKLRSLGFVEDASTTTESIALDADSNPGQIFLPDSSQLPNLRPAHTLDPSWSTPHYSGRRRDNNMVDGGAKKKGMARAEPEMPLEELRRLRTVGIKLKKVLKVGKAGITEGIVNGIHERWRSSEVVKVVCEDVWGMNMKRTHDLLERKTGGMVVWRAGSKVVLYRGADYKYPYFSLDQSSTQGTSHDLVVKEDGVSGYFDETRHSSIDAVVSSGSNLSRTLAQSSMIQGVGQPNRVRLLMPGEQKLVDEADQLLDGLGPRYSDWWGCAPLPVDADLLPSTVPGYRRPFRLLPYGVKPKLTDAERTVLKRLGASLPCHFALGRNRDLHGLAAAIVKLWEKSELAKIAVKKGVLNTDSKPMAEELKSLTGGVLLSRDQDFIVLYRGKDFLPLAVSIAIEERRKNRMQIDKQLISYGSMNYATDSSLETAVDIPAGNSRVDHLGKNIESEKKTNNSIEVATKRTGVKLSVAAEMQEANLEQREVPQEVGINEGGITEEERYMLQKVGLKMKPYLLLGRRGVFDGTVENIHLHWKYRELVKIICGGKSIEEAYRVAGILEAESGGILIGVERVSKGFAIIIYRGRNYKRPASLRPRTLLNKKEAMKRSLEIQHYESLKLDVLKLPRSGKELQPELLTVNEDDVVKDKAALLNDGMDSIEHQKQIDANNDRKLNEIDDNDFELKGQMSGLAIIESPNSKFEPADPLNNLASRDLEKSANLLSTTDSELHGFNDEISEMAGESAKIKTIPVFPKAEDHKSYVSLARVAPLSNKERLLLRKEALNMKRRPLFSVDKNNVFTGVAKAIREHFKKYPLAIVNVKGRAKGSSVQEVVLKLEQATGGVLVSQEPSKVILYRGWGAGMGSDYPMARKDKADEVKCLPSMPVPPQLITAMKLEFGLLASREKNLEV